QTRYRTSVITVKIPHIGRKLEESLVADLIIRVIGDATSITEFNWTSDYDATLIESKGHFEANVPISGLVYGTTLMYYPQPVDDENPIILSGSFNPLHE